MEPWEEYQEDEILHHRKNEVKSDEELVWMCNYCGSDNYIWVDLTIPGKQDFVEDCSVCCRPNHLLLTPTNDGDAFLESRSTVD